MFGTLAIIIGAPTVFFAVLLEFFGSLNLFILVALVTSFNIIQWLFTPHLINVLYKVREVTPSDFPKLHAMVESLSRKSGIISSGSTRNQPMKRF